MTNQPFTLTSEEIQEISEHPGVREMWGATDSEEMRLAFDQIYAAKFQFGSGCPGYVGDLFIIQGDALDPTIQPVRLLRNHENELEILS